MGISKNVRVLIDLLLAGRVLTLLLIPIIVLSVVFEYLGYELAGGELFIALVGTIAAFAFLKASLLLVFYNLVYRSEFDGSPFVVAALSCVFLLVALSTAAYLGSSRADDISSSDLIFMLIGSFVFFTVVLWLATRAMHCLAHRSSPDGCKIRRQE